MHSLQAAEDFSKARWKAFLSRMGHFMTPESDDLLSLEDVKEILKPKNETYKGMQVVTLDRIVGSEGRYRDFNKYFLPRSEHLRSRWERVDMAHIQDIILPPIQLYEIGGVYFVRDGNHRVSVARSQGIESIDAEVTSLSSEIVIEPEMNSEDLKQAVLDYEKKLFYDKTHFGKLTECRDLDFSSPGRYDEIYNHIAVHKYYLNEKSKDEIPFSQALISWYANVYKPIIDIIKEGRLCTRFPERTPSDLYVWIVKHWDSLKHKYGVHYSASDAAQDFASKYGQSRTSTFKEMSAALLKLPGVWIRHILGKNR